MSFNLRRRWWRVCLYDFQILWKDIFATDAIHWWYLSRLPADGLSPRYLLYVGHWMFFHMTTVHMLLTILPLGDLHFVPIPVPSIFKLCLCQSCRYLYQFLFTYSRVKTKRPNSRNPDLPSLMSDLTSSWQVWSSSFVGNHKAGRTRATIWKSDHHTKQTKPNQTYAVNLPTCSLQTLPTTYRIQQLMYDLPYDYHFVYSALLE